MSKIRINELARELEVKPQRILDLLPELGVAEKKTHSSSLDEDHAELVRRHFGVSGARPDTFDHERDHEPAVKAPAAEPDGAPAAAAPKETAHAQRPAAAPEAAEPGPAAAEAEAAHETEAARPKPTPLRPPLLGGSHRPIQPPIGMTAPSMPLPPSRPAAPPPAAKPAAPPRPAAPPQPRPTAAAPTTPAPAAPAAPPAGMPVSPRPGQVLTGGPRTPIPSGPRQPMPGSVLGAPGTSPGAPRPPVVPQRPMAQQPRAATTATAPPAGQVAPGQARPLAGQPVARPVVPPRADVLARLQQQQQPRVSPGQPAPAARPGMPSRPAAGPGQPIYRGPIRPGQPIVRPGTGPGGPGGPAARGTRPRPMHPTSARVEPAAPPPTDTTRRQHQPRGRVVERREEEEGRLRMPSRRSESAPLPAINREITVSEGITVKELSEKLGVKANLVIKKLFDKKIYATINQTLDVKTAEEIAREFGASTNKISYEEESTFEIESAEVETDRIKRAPVVTIMGHVDHGKTSILDAIRLSHVADREAGGITQHIGAYHVIKNGRKIVFIDTPGHEAFTQMRARGAKVTDIVILVVAADDGVMPQTLEAINHAKAASVPIIVAINKIDKPGEQRDRIKQQLSDRGLVPEDWGGDTVMVPVSAKTKENLELLLEMILLVADMQDLKANPERPGVGVVLEAKLDRGRGPVPTVLVRNGTLKVGDYFICGSVFGKVRAMYDDLGEQVREAEPSTPVEVLGLESLPEIGDTFQVVTDTAKAKQIVIYREAKTREQAMARGQRVTLETLHQHLQEGETKDLNVILKTDVGGSAEVLTDMMQKLSNDKVRVRVIHSGVGAINETDVLLASASEAIIIGFNVRPERNAQTLAEQEKVDIRLHTIIYELADEMKRAMTGMLEPVFKEAWQGRAEVREVFRISKVGNVAGCMVQEGLIRRDSQVRVLRDNIVIFTGKVESLKRFKNDASEVKNGFECGIQVHNFNDVKPGDVIEAFTTERVAPEVLA
ncbi:MAG TPA: translation initiation factor IF-2 [Bryobacteraceae bacterium]|nr:translation initiation factor IF-2 [Bryobacteraceae bacterium]